MMSLGIHSRLSTKIAIQIPRINARILCLPPHSPVFGTVAGARSRSITGQAGLDDAIIIARHTQESVKKNFSEMAPYKSFNTSVKARIRQLLRQLNIGRRHGRALG